MTPTKQMIERLKPCPFCGAKAEAYIAFPHSDTPWHVGVDHGDICPMRITDSHCYKTQAEATAAWNTRPTIETLTPSAAGEGVEGMREGSRERGAETIYEYTLRVDAVEPPRRKCWADLPAGNYDRQRCLAAFDAIAASGAPTVPISAARLADIVAPLVPGSRKAASARNIAAAICAALTASPPNQPHPDIEGRARELIADEADSEGFTEYASWLRSGCPNDHARFGEEDRDDLAESLAFRTLVKALTLPCAEIRREALEEAAAWHDQRYRDTPDAFEMEFHDVSRKAIRSLASKEDGRS